MTAKNSAEVVKDLLRERSAYQSILQAIITERDSLKADRDYWKQRAIGMLLKSRKGSELKVDLSDKPPQ